jgi:hypothetical protein
VGFALVDAGQAQGVMPMNGQVVTCRKRSPKRVFILKKNSVKARCLIEDIFSMA